MKLKIKNHQAKTHALCDLVADIMGVPPENRAILHALIIRNPDSAYNCYAAIMRSYQPLRRTKRIHLG